MFYVVFWIVTIKTRILIRGQNLFFTRQENLHDDVIMIIMTKSWAREKKKIFRHNRKPHIFAKICATPKKMAAAASASASDEDPVDPCEEIVLYLDERDASEASLEEFEAQCKHKLSDACVEFFHRALAKAQVICSAPGTSIMPYTILKQLYDDDETEKSRRKEWLKFMGATTYDKTVLTKSYGTSFKSPDFRLLRATAVLRMNMGQECLTTQTNIQAHGPFAAIPRNSLGFITRQPSPNNKFAGRVYGKAGDPTKARHDAPQTVFVDAAFDSELIDDFMTMEQQQQADVLHGSGLGEMNWRMATFLAETNKANLQSMTVLRVAIPRQRGMYPDHAHHVRALFDDDLFSDINYFVLLRASGRFLEVLAPKSFDVTEEETLSGLPHVTKVKVTGTFPQSVANLMVRSVSLMQWNEGLVRRSRRATYVLAITSLPSCIPAIGNAQKDEMLRMVCKYIV